MVRSLLPDYISVSVDKLLNNFDLMFLDFTHYGFRLCSFLADQIPFIFIQHCPIFEIVNFNILLSNPGLSASSLPLLFFLQLLSFNFSETSFSFNLPGLGAFLGGYKYDSVFLFSFLHFFFFWLHYQPLCSITRIHCEISPF